MTTEPDHLLARRQCNQLRERYQSIQRRRFDDDLPAPGTPLGSELIADHQEDHHG